MATRSGGGTGVIVALVVFIITTVFLLVMTIVFYSNYNKTRADLQAKESAESKYATREERQREDLKRVESTLGPGQSIYGFLSRQLAEMSTFVSGSPGMTLEEARTQLRINAPETIRQHLNTLRGDLTSRQNELDSLTAMLTARGEEVASLRGEIEQLKLAQQRELESVRGVIATSSQASKDYGDQFSKALDDLDRTKDRLESNYRDKEADLRRQIESYSQENVVLRTRVDQLQRAVEAIRIKPKNPAELVDARVIDVAGNDQVFIDIGDKNRVVLGMTFEVYDDPTSIRPNETTGEYPRGKASLQVIKVADTTATAKITRSSPGRPVVKNDVVANAIYDPNYRFKFLVHGVFDIDGDGRSTLSEAEYLRAQIVQWGGTVVEGDTLVGDLDFLVLGTPPKEPAPLPPSPSEELLDTFVRQREVYDTYNALFNQAKQAQIPVLNWTRLQVLTGAVNR